MLIVMKFGGTSVGSAERIAQAAQLATASVEQGHTVVVVTSAMSGVTNLLIDAAREASTGQWDPQRRDVFLLNGSRISALYASGQIEAGIAAAQELVKRQGARTGANSFETAASRGVLAIGYARAARDEVDVARVLGLGIEPVDAHVQRVVHLGRRG